jgi:uncharacterized membrane protein
MGASLLAPRPLSPGPSAPGSGRRGGRATATVAGMQNDASWALLALALGLVLALTAAAAWLAVTEVRAVRPARAGRRGVAVEGSVAAGAVEPGGSVAETSAEDGRQDREDHA